MQMMIAASTLRASWKTIWSMIIFYSLYFLRFVFLQLHENTSFSRKETLLSFVKHGARMCSKHGLYAHGSFIDVVWQGGLVCYCKQFVSANRAMPHVSVIYCQYRNEQNWFLDITTVWFQKRLMLEEKPMICLLNTTGTQGEFRKAVGNFFTRCF